MPIMQITQVLDDYDGSELDSETEPMELVINGSRFRLYLSDDNKQSLVDFLADYTKNAEETKVPTFRPITSAASPVGITPEERKELQSWVAQQGGKFKPVADRGRVAEATIAAWREATKQEDDTEEAEAS